MKDRATRFPSLRTVTLIAAGAQYRGRIRNVSQTGARLHLPEPIDFGGTLALHTAQGSWQACMIWRRGTEAGVKFLSPLNPAELRHLQYKGHSTRSLQPTLRSPAFRTDP